MLSHLLSRGSAVTALDGHEQPLVLCAGFLRHAFDCNCAQDPLLQQIANEVKSVHQDAVGSSVRDREMKVHVGLHKLLRLLARPLHLIEQISQLFQVFCARALRREPG